MLFENLYLKSKSDTRKIECNNGLYNVLVFFSIDWIDLIDREKPENKNIGKKMIVYIK